MVGEFYRAQSEYHRAQAEYHTTQAARCARLAEREDAREPVPAAPPPMPDARIGVRDVAQLLNRPVSFVYRHTSPSSDLPPMPHRRLAANGKISFIREEVLAWAAQYEIVEQAGPIETIAARELERRARRSPTNFTER